MRFNLLLLLCLVLTGKSIKASDIIEVLPLTNKIIWVHFDDGTVTYPNALSVDRLDVAAAKTPDSWAISSVDDPEFLAAQNPEQVGRKSKGTEFKKDPEIWAGSSFNPTTKPWASEHDFYLVLNKSLKNGKTYTLATGNLAANGATWTFTYDESALRSEAVHVNTIGYAKDAPKYGYVYQWMGDLGGLDLSVYSGSKYRVYMEGNSTAVKEGTIRKRKSATNAETSQTNDTPNQNFLGAEVYDCDFSDITDDGTYYLVVEGFGKSYPFKIGTDAVYEAYYNVMRGLYHQRAGIRLAPPYTKEGYIRPVNQNTKVTSDDGVDFAGKLLYSDYPYTSWAESDGGGGSQPAIRDAAIGKPLDVAGWYHDAGDWDQYFTHESIPVILMLSYELAPELYSDADLNIPESGNGIPDIIDEASWLIKFNYRLRKELIAKGYSNGGVGGARICADVFTSVDGSAESSLPSWKESRRTIVTQADAFMTYFYAGQASQFALILKSLGKNPNRFPVEMLDHVDFASMSHDSVNWTKEAEEAFVWASAPANQPSGHTNYSNELKVYRLYAATNLFRVTGKQEYKNAAELILNELKNSTSLSEDVRWGVYSYLIANNKNIDKVLQSELKALALNTAGKYVLDAVDKRACRWGGAIDMPMLVGQATTPMILEAIAAYALTGDIKYKNAIHTTADYFLGTNPRHTTWMTGVGPRPAACGFHLDSRYNNNWVLYPGFIPYGPWSMAYGVPAFTWTVDGVSITGGMGPWDKDWANFSQYPQMTEWPGHERWNSNIHSPMSSENTIHQNTVYGGIAYGFANSRQNKNSSSPKKIESLTLSSSEIFLDIQGKDTLVYARPDINDASFAALKWASSDPRVAWVDGFGRVSGITSGTCTISVSTLDESVSASCTVTCSWPEIDVEQISIEPDTISIVEGQKKNLSITFLPADASNKFANWSYSIEGIVSVDENGTLTAVAPGDVWVIATSLNGSKKDSCWVHVKMAIDFVMADFDVVIPVTTEPQPDFAQLYTPTGANDVAYANPIISGANPSEKVVKWDRPEGDWKLLGMVLPTDHPQDLTEFAQFQFKYFGSGIKDFFIQMIASDQSKIEINESVIGEECWQMYTYNLTENKKLVQFNVFVNKTGNPQAIPILFDDFILAGKAAQRFDEITISETMVEIDSPEMYTLSADAAGHSFTWVSSDPSVASVDQNGKISAVSGGTAIIKAVPLYGNQAECTVVVDGGVPSGISYDVIADFETIALDWSGGYGAYGWASDSVAKADNPLKQESNESDKAAVWRRDGTNLWAGFGLIFPPHSTTGMDFLTFQVLSGSPVNVIRLEVKNADITLGAYQLNSLEIQANTWTTVSYDLADLGISDKDINTLNFQIAGGSDENMLIYIDNIMLRTKGEIRVTDIKINETGPLTKFMNDPSFSLTASVVPEDATNKSVEWSSKNSSVVSVGSLGAVQIVGIGTTYIIVKSVENPEIKDSIRVDISKAVGLNPDQDAQIEIYPNPFNEYLSVKYLSGLEKIELTNILGNLIQKIEPQGALSITIHTAELPAGVYLLRFYNKTGFYSTRKIIKK